MKIQSLQRLARLGAAFGLVGALWGSTCVSAHETHAHGGATSVAAPPCAPLTVACARSATPAMGPEGKVWLVWSYDDQLYVSASTDGGVSFPTVAAVTAKMPTLDDNSEARPKLVVLADGSLLLAFTQRDKHYNGRLFTARSVDGGVTFSPPQPMLGESGQRFETPVVLPNGRVVLAWLDQRNQKLAKARGQVYKDTGVAVAWTDDGGKSFQGKSILADYSCDCCRMAAALDPQGHAVLVWRHVFDGTTRDHAAAMLQSDGTLGPIRRVAVDDWKLDACPMHGPSISIADDGAWHITWYTGAPGKAGLYYARSADQGASFSVAQGLGNASRRPTRPQVLALANGVVWRAWKEFDGRTTYVMAQRSVNQGELWSAPVELAKTQGASDHPVLLAHQGEGYLSWLTRDEGYALRKLAAVGAR